MENPKIYATGNSDIPKDSNVSYYIFEKDETFLDWLGELLETVLEINNGKNIAKYNIIRNDDEDEANEEHILKDINKIIDIHEHYENKGDRVDLFYGKDRVYLTLRRSEETRKRLAGFIKRTKTWIEIKEKPSKIRHSHNSNK